MIPAQTARASLRHHGAPMPASAGRKRTPPASSTERASASVSPTSATSPIPSRSQSITVPAENTPPSTAYVVTPSTVQATTGRRPSGVGGVVPAFARMKMPVPYVAFVAPGSRQPCPASAAVWSTSMARSGSPVSVPRSPVLSTIRGSQPASRSNASSSSASQRPGRRSAWSCVREAVEVSVIAPSPSRAVTYASSVPTRSEPSRAASATAACSSSRWRSFVDEK